MTEVTSAHDETYMQTFLHWVKNHVPRIGADTLEWMAIVTMHCATIPSILALMAGISDKAPSLDIVLFVWTSLVLLFVRAVILKSKLNTVTNGAGFIVQAVMMALVLFK